MKIGLRLAFSFAAIILLLVITSVIALIDFKNVKDNVDNMIHDKYPKTVEANKITYNINTIARSMRNMLLYSQENQAEQLTRIDSCRKNILSSISYIDTTEKSSEGRAKLNQLVQARAGYVGLQDQFIALAKQRKNEEAALLLENEIRVTQAVYFKSIEDLINYTDEQMHVSEEVISSTVSTANTLTIIILIVSIIIGITLTIVISRGITRPVNQALEAANQIAKGDMNVKLDTNRKDETGVLINALKKMTETIKALVTDVNKLSETAVNGQLDKRADSEKFHGEYKNLVLGINATLDAVINPMNVTAEYIDRISKGDIPAKVTETYKGDFNEIKINLNSLIDALSDVTNIALEISKGNLNNKITLRSSNDQLMIAMQTMTTAINTLVTDANLLSQAAVDGKLDTRADATRHQGDYRRIVEGINKTLDNVIGPLNVAAEYVDRISKGDIPPKITDNYKGDFNEIKNNLNTCIEAVNNLVADAKMLADAGVEGKLDTRADASKHQGEFRAIVDGVNKTLDYVLTPIKEAVAVLKSMADGDLTSSMKRDYKGDALVMKSAVNDTIEAMNEILTQVKTTVEEVSRGAMQVSDASTSLSQGATEQAASLEQITSSMAEIGSQTKMNAENANQAKILTYEAKESADKGNKEMDQLNKAMSEITESSRNISKIIKVIDEIAFQTNLLALNAAVEAARAGRHGKGFAVVAEEVRNLAARSATAAKETSEMIENSIKTVENGSHLAARTGQALEEIRNGAIKAADIVGEIATSSNEQAQGIAQINEGLTQIDKVTQTNTASAEESASASEELSSQANQLKQLILRFKLKNYRDRYDTRDDSGYRRPSMMAAGKRSSRSLPQPAYKEADDYGKRNPEDIIRLDEGNFGKY